MKINNTSLIYIIVFAVSHTFIVAGPPFITDDPDAVPYKHGETYLTGSLGAKSKNEFYAFLPFFEVDYGVCKDTQLHMLIPFSIDKKRSRRYTMDLVLLRWG